METIKFSVNWNKKLDCDFFTTIRLSNRFNIGDFVWIECKGMDNKVGEIMTKHTTVIEKLTDLVCYQDTGYNKVTTVGLIKKTYGSIDNWETQKIYIYGISTKSIGISELEASKRIKARIDDLFSNPVLKEMYDKHHTLPKGG